MVDDRPARPGAERTVQIDDVRVRAGDWRFAPDAAPRRHRHESALVEVGLKGADPG